MRDVFAAVYKYAAKWLGDDPVKRYTTEQFCAMVDDMEAIVAMYKDDEDFCRALLMAVYDEVVRRNEK